MKTPIFKTALFIIALFFAFTFSAQEHLAPLGGNMHLMGMPPAKHAGVKKIQTVGPVNLPFFDDFYYAYKSPYPVASKWMDSSVYVNTGFAIAPISIGVATFDGLNKHGYPYVFSAGGGSSAGADTLTSVPINLEKIGSHPYSAVDSIYLSFYYQAEGNGDAPEASDSLCLEFYQPHQKSWRNVWGVKGYNPSDSAFYYVMIPVGDTAYFDSTFQFRFRNKATLSGSLDHWHLDYVRMEANRSVSEDTTYKDLTFAYMPSSLLKSYGAMPYEQYIPSELASNFSNYIRNNFPGPPTNLTYEYQVFAKNNPVPIFTANEGPINVDPFPVSGYDSFAPHRYPATSTSSSTLVLTPAVTDTTFFTAKHFVFSTFSSTSADMVPLNDTIYQTQRFSNYYAYDDGAAEVAYYVNTQGAKLALGFTLNHPDTLRAMDIFFDPISFNATQLHDFRISVWDQGGNGPVTNYRYQDSTMHPVYMDWGYNNIPRYVLTSPLALTQGTYYFGIKQGDATPLNIGFDRNTNHMDRLYYDIGFGWTQSSIPGSLMIHPVFGKNSLVITGVEGQAATQKKLQLYPNPAQDKVFISLKNDNSRYTTVEIMSVMGQTALQSRYESADAAIDISTLQSGIYFIYLSGPDSKSVPEKLIISR